MAFRITVVHGREICKYIYEREIVPLCYSEKRLRNEIFLYVNELFPVICAKLFVSENLFNSVWKSISNGMNAIITSFNKVPGVFLPLSISVVPGEGRCNYHIKGKTLSSCPKMVP